jgi:hypothetical protein
VTTTIDGVTNAVVPIITELDLEDMEFTNRGFGCFAWL